MPIMENQMEKQMEHDVETGLIFGLTRVGTENPA